VLPSRLRWLPDALSFRIPAFVFGALLTYWLAILGAQRSRPTALFAPALFWCAERTFFHGHLACFDVPICALTAGVGVAWARAIGILDASTPSSTATSTPTSSRVCLAFLFGCALAVKHNAWLLPPVLLVHALLLPSPLR